ncbi:hypothetical protein ONZ45_g7532 [Pleurotus djamor]|nr:hypothetical protein ONZ45_g7532 [Pleurotus djamor]
MHLSSLLAFSTLSLVGSLVEAQITLGQDFQASGTLLLTNLASPSLLDNGTSTGLISGSSIDSSCPFPTYGIPDGASIGEPLDVFTGPDIDLDTWFTISYVSPCIAHYTW